MNKLYLHIGTHKTGTTEIQQNLNLARNSLKKEGLIYIPYFPVSFEMMQLQCINKNIIIKCIDYLQKQTRHFTDQYGFIMSFEGFSGDLKQGYKNSHFVAKTLREATHEFDVTIIVYLRRQDTFLESVYTQFIQQGESFSFSEFMGNYDTSSFNWYQLINNYSELFGINNIILERYDKKYLPDKKSLVKNFSNIIGSKSLKELESEKNHNIGYDMAALEVARLCNPLLNEDEKKTLRHILQSSGTKQPFSNYGYFTLDERLKYVEGYRDSNAQIARDYFGDNSGILFPDNDSYDKNTYQLTNNDISSILVLLIKELNKINKIKSRSTLARIFDVIRKILRVRKSRWSKVF